jgi:hypothetical protein
MTRAQMLQALVTELEKVGESLPSNAKEHLDNLRADINVSPAWESVLKAMQRVEEDCAHDSPQQ